MSVFVQHEGVETYRETESTYLERICVKRTGPTVSAWTSWDERETVLSLMVNKISYFVWNILVNFSLVIFGLCSVHQALYLTDRLPSFDVGGRRVPRGAHWGNSSSPLPLQNIQFHTLTLFSPRRIPFWSRCNNFTGSTRSFIRVKNPNPCRIYVWFLSWFCKVCYCFGKLWTQKRGILTYLMAI